MAIYTRMGDKGNTAVYGGKNTVKSDRLIMAYGDMDELSSQLGVVICHVKKEDANLLSDIQRDLYLLMGHLSGAPTPLSFVEESITHFEKVIDREEQKLSPLSHFILPQGTLASCELHVARTICRRAERKVVALLRGDRSPHFPIVKYLNRLSDLLFIMARKYNTKEVVITNL